MDFSSASEVFALLCPGTGTLRDGFFKQALKTLALLTSLLFTIAATAQPARIILLRHAEKPADETDVHLSDRGQQRAKALAGWATNSPAWGINARPAAVFACKPTPKAPSLRAIETITPFATRLQLTVQTPFPAKNYAALARQILDDPALKGKTVVICWVRDELPQLAKAFGVKSGGENWKKNVFDRFWLISFQNSTATLSDLPQQLLPGDTVEVSQPGQLRPDHLNGQGEPVQQDGGIPQSLPASVKSEPRSGHPK